jgi:glucose-6-phosphate 1-epimerase
MTMEESVLDQTVEIPGVAEIQTGNGGLPKVRITTAEAVGEIYLLGAHLAAWKPANSQDVIWLSEKSWWQAGKSIRGGVPLCFPWFGPKKDDPQAPGHGFARIRQWQLDSIAQEDRAVTVNLFTKSDASTKAWWPADFELRYQVTFGAKLVLRLELTNTGESMLRAEEAFHTYFCVGDVRHARVNGLDGVRYIDRIDGAKEKKQEGAITIMGETDRLYLNATGTAEIEDPVLRRRIRVSKQGSAETVVWNPWITKSKAMPDFGDEEWPGMICLETCNVANPVELAPGQRHTMTATIEVDAL